MKAAEIYTLFVDLDGVMADLDRFCLENLGHTFSEDKKVENAVWAGLNRMQDQGRKTFAVLPLMADAMELWGAIQPFRPHILTATGDRYQQVAQEKRDWVRRHLPNHGDIITVQSSRDKAQHAAATHVLIDDRMKSIGPWREAGGIGILHVNAQTTLDQLRSLGIDFDSGRTNNEEPQDE